MLKTTKFTGLNSDTHSASVLVLSPSDNLFVLLYCEGEDVFARSRQTLSTLEDIFTTSSGSAVEKVQNLYQAVEQSLKDVVKLEYIIASLNSKNALYLMYRGQGIDALLIRPQGVSNLLSISQEGTLISGFIQPGERVVFETKSLRDVLGADWERLILAPLDSFIEDVEAHLSDHRLAPVAAIMIEDVVNEPVAEPFVTPHRQSRSLKVGLSKKVVFYAVILLAVILLGTFAYKKISHPRQEPKKAMTEIKDNNKSYAVDNPVVWLDLSLVKKDFKAISFSFSLNNFLILDQNQKTLIEVNAAKKSNQILSGQDKLKDARLVSLNGDLAYVYSKDLGVMQLDTKNQTQKVVVKVDEAWGEIKSLVVFAGNIYLLDAVNNQILKYLPTTNGFSDKQNYFASSVEANLSDVKLMQIDSSLWLLKPKGEIAKYTQGNPDYFSASGLETPLKNPLSFYISSDTDNLYILDQENNRVVVLDKKGVYQKEFKNNVIKNMIDLAVDEENKKIYLLDGTKIYQVDLK